MYLCRYIRFICLVLFEMFILVRLVVGDIHLQCNSSLSVPKTLEYISWVMVFGSKLLPGEHSSRMINTIKRGSWMSINFYFWVLVGES